LIVSIWPSICPYSLSTEAVSLQYNCMYISVLYVLSSDVHLMQCMCAANVTTAELTFLQSFTECRLICPVAVSPRPVASQLVGVPLHNASSVDIWPQ
jgi:hypothetical protein